MTADNTGLWVLALAELSTIKMTAHRSRKLALEALRRAANEADAWDSEGEARFSEALDAEQYAVAECVAGNQIRSTHLRWELAKFEANLQQPRRNCITPLI